MSLSLIAASEYLLQEVALCGFAPMAVGINLFTEGATDEAMQMIDVGDLCATAPAVAFPV